MDRRAKIICTIGPATDKPEILRPLIESGMDAARLNFSHGRPADHARVIETVRDLAARVGRPVAILQDLQGPKIRIGDLRGGRAELKAGSRFVLTTSPLAQGGNEERASVSYRQLAAEVHPGESILLQDGLLRLEVTQVQDGEVICTVRDGGILRQHAGINLPGSDLSVPSLTSKDLADLSFGLEHGVDLVALSFVRRATDVEALREAVAAGRGSPLLVAKLEKPQAISDLDGILDASDWVMVARGDLGVEVSPERVPFMQKTIIRDASTARVPVITATQMLESMIENPRPTRAEASDVANAVFDGTDAVMLSGETSIGKYPLEALRMMDRIVREAERHSTSRPEQRRREPGATPSSFADAVAEAAGRCAAEVQATALVAFTRSGFTARLISKHRPVPRLVAYTPEAHVTRQLALYWGVAARTAPMIEDQDALIAWADRDLQQAGLLHPGDAVVFVAGAPGHRHGITNLMRLHRTGDFSP